MANEWSLYADLLKKYTPQGALDNLLRKVNPAYSWLSDKYNEGRDVVYDGGKEVYDAYADVFDGGTSPMDYKPWYSLLPGWDSIQQYQDKKKQWEDYYNRTGRYPAYTSSMQTFGSMSDLASGIQSDVKKGLYAVGGLYKKF